MKSLIPLFFLLLLVVVVDVSASESEVSFAQKIYDKVKSGEIHAQLVQDIKNRNSGNTWVQEAIEKTYLKECLSNNRISQLKSYERFPIDLQRQGLNRYENTVDPFDLGVSLALLERTTEKSRGVAPFCAEVTRATIIEIPKVTIAGVEDALVQLYFGESEREKYFYIANFSYYDIEVAEKYMQSQKENIANDIAELEECEKEKGFWFPAERTGCEHQDAITPLAQKEPRRSAETRVRLRYLNQSGAEKLYVARVPKEVSAVMSQDVHMFHTSGLQAALTFGPRLISHLQVRFVFAEGVTIKPQRFNPGNAQAVESKLIHDMIFTTEANGLPNFEYDGAAEHEVASKIGVIDWQDPKKQKKPWEYGTFLNYYRLKSLPTAIRDSFPHRHESMRASYPMLQHSLRFDSDEKRNGYFEAIINMAAQHGAHRPYSLYWNNCANGVFGALDNVITATPSKVVNKLIGGTIAMAFGGGEAAPPLVSFPWQTHNSYINRKVMTRADRPRFNQKTMKEYPQVFMADDQRKYPTHGVYEFCDDLKENGQKDAFNICQSFDRAP